MAQFDIIAASSKAYKSVWEGREYFLKLALAPFLIKSACLVFATAFASGDTAAFLFFMLPALFAEGWMLSHSVRFHVLGQTWPFRPTGNMEQDMAVLRVRARGVLSGTIVYVLIGMALGVLTLLAQIYLMPYATKEAMESGVPVPAPIAIVSMLGLGFLFWGFRLAWLYIPFALNSDPRYYFFRMRGFGTSISMIGVWLLCLLPFLLILRILAGVVAAPIAGLMGDTAGFLVMTLIVAAADTAKSLIVTAGMTNGMREVYARDEGR